jgi:DNA polymerase III sliding clamp (beta) subunit (PCNA family)
MQLSRKDTLAALEAVKPAVASRSAIIETTHLWFTGTHVWATDGGLGIKVKFDSPIKCGVPGSLFFGLLNQAAADTLEFDYDDNVLAFKAGRSRVKLNTLPLEQGRIWRFPDRASGKPKATIKVSEHFIAGLKRVLALKPVARSRMEHHAVCIYAEGEEMDLYTTDSRSMLVTPVTEKLIGTVEKIALPRDLAQQIVDQCAPGEDLKMYADYFTTTASNRVTLYSNVLDTSEMLDIPTFADTYANDKVSAPVPIPEGFTAALERALLVAGSDAPSVRLTTNGKSLKFFGHYKAGEVEEEFQLTKAAAKGTILADAKTLLGVKDVKKLAIFDGKALTLRDDEGFMYMLAAKEEPRATARGSVEEPAEEEA